MTLHFIHVGKTGGTALKRALIKSGVAYRENWDPERAAETPYGRVVLHRHRFKLQDVPAGDGVFFCVRDPISRYLSGFYSRLNRGEPRYHYEWTTAEQRAFQKFRDPQALAVALVSADEHERAQAGEAMRAIRHLRPMRRQLGTRRQLRARHVQIIYIARQETLADDWEQLKALLDLPPDVRLPSRPVSANRRDTSGDVRLEDAAVSALRDWYRLDYDLLRYCDGLRAWHGWGAPSAHGPKDPRTQLARVRGIPALLPQPATLRRLLS
jgi:Sulfotransferase family